MKHLWVAYVCLILGSTSLMAQKKTLPKNINSPGNNQKDPKLSADGTTMIYMSDYSVSRKYEPLITTGNGIDRWNDGNDFVGLFKQSLDLEGGYFLNADATELYFTSRRAPSIGNFDIVRSKKNGNTWLPPENLGKPVNSPGNEGAPSLSIDGKDLYFMRCSQMDNANAEDCKIFITTRKGGRWSEPEEIPGTINDYNAGYPVILADNSTLLFSSSRPGGKGGWDFYIVKKDGNRWSEPVNVEIANTPNDEKVGSIPASGDIIFYSGEYKGYQNLIIAKVPEELQPKKILFIEGEVTDKAGQPIQAIISAYDAETNEEMALKRTGADGSYQLFLPEGHYYDFSVFPFQNDHTYFSCFYDFTEPESGKREDRQTTLQPLQSGVTFKLNNLVFTPYDTTISETSRLEFLRLKRLFQNNQGLGAEFSVYVNQVFTDSVSSDPDLTERKFDTLFYELDYASLDSLTIDSIYRNFPLAEDSTMYYEVDVTYHNDRTHKQANSILKYLEKEGFPMDSFSAKGHGGEPRPKPDTVRYWVEVTLK